MKRVLWVVIPVIILAAVIVWRLHVNQANALTQGPAGGHRRGPTTVATAPVQTRDIVKMFAGTANIESPDTVKIAPKVSGQIDFLQVHEGDHVTRGQVLVRIDPTELEAEVRKSQADVAEAQARLVQARATQNPVNVGVGTTIQQQQATVASAQADYNQAKQNYAAQVAAADAAVTDAQGRVDAASASVNNAQAGIRNSQANLANASAKLARLESLYKQNFIAAQDVDDARTTVSVQQGNTDVARAQLGSAQAALASAQAQKRAAEQQAAITRTKGQADIADALARLNQAKAALVNAKANTAQRPAYVANLQALQASVMSARGALANAEAQLSQTVLRSPIDGFVTARTADPGTLAQPSEPVLTLQSIRQVWANLPVPEEQIGAVRPGMTATVRVDSLPDVSFVGRVVQINPSADPASRQFTVRIALDNSRNLLKPGMFARVSFVAQKLHDVITVPLEAVQTDQDGSQYVWVVNSQSAVEKHPVTVGGSDDKGTQILSGVTPGMKVVTLFNGHLADGTKVSTGHRRGGQGGAAGAPGGGGGYGGGGNGSAAPASDTTAPGAGSSPAPAGAPGATPGGHHHHRGGAGAAAGAPAGSGAGL